jgi:hypothetical protein
MMVAPSFPAMGAECLFLVEVLLCGESFCGERAYSSWR